MASTSVNDGSSGAARQPGDSLSSEDIQSLVGQMIDEAKEYNDTELQPKREAATNYYQSEPYGNEEEGRSQVVTTEVADVVQGFMPSLLRIFAGPERAVEYKPRGDEDEGVAEQQTDYVNYVVFEDNAGFMQLYSGMKDALIRKVGIFKWWWDDAEHAETATYSGLDEQQLEELQADEDVEVGTIEIDDTGDRTTYSAIVTNRYSGRVKFQACPGEEVSWNRTARSVGDALIMVHTREVRADELMGMGYAYEDIEEAIGASSISENPDEDARVAHLSETGGNADDEAQDWFTRPVRFDEAYVYLNVDGEEEEASLCKVSMVGDQHVLLEDPNTGEDYEKVSHRPFAFICPIPEPHTLVGMSEADRVMDLQKINSSVLRGTLDSLALSLDPRTEMVDGQVNYDDLMNPEIGGVVRVRQPNMLREVAHRFVGGDTLPFMQYLAEVKENRTGMSKAAAGLDADALQSASKMAVAATVTGSQQQIEMVARIFAETGIKDLYKGLLRTIVEHQDFERTVRIRNEWVTIDPRGWEATADVVVNVALGGGMPEEQQQTMREILGKQEQIMGTLGPTNPLVGVHQYSNTLHRIVEMSGRKNSDQYFTRITKEEADKLAAQAEQAAQQKQQQQEPPDPAAMAIAQAELKKAETAQMQAQMQAAAKQQELELREQEMKLKDDRERDKQAADTVIRLHELQLKYEGSLTRAAIDAEIAEERARLDAVTRENVAEITAVGHAHGKTSRGDSE